MKKYLFGLLAIVIAVGMSAFTKKTTFSTVFYEYIAPSGSFATAHVQDKSNWQLVAEEEMPCEEDLEQLACVIGIDDSYIEFPAQSRLDDADADDDLVIEAEQSTLQAAVVDIEDADVNTSILPVKNNTLE